MRVDFAGGWLDHPCSNVDSKYFVVNCAISPLVGFDKWIYREKSGLGGSAAAAILRGWAPIEAEAKNHNGWQDAVSILETGICVWRSGKVPILVLKRNPDWLRHRMVLLWTGAPHKPGDLSKEKRCYDSIKKASIVANEAVEKRDIEILQKAVDMTYGTQIDEGMEELPQAIGGVRKYCGSGWGGYALYLFKEVEARDRFLRGTEEGLPIEPYINDKYC